MSIELTTPSEELARRLTEDVSYDQRLMGIKMSAMGGGNPSPLFSLRQVANFIHVGKYEEIALATRGATVGYVDPAALATWIATVLGDEELSKAVSELISGGEVYGKIALPVRELLESRLDQCEALLGLTEEPAEAATADASETAPQG